MPLLAGTVAALGFLNLWSAILAHGPGRDRLLRDVVHVPLMVLHGTRTLTALFGLALVMLARSLGRHKRQAWRLTVLLIGISPFLHIVKGLDFEEALISLILLVSLIVHRSSFYAENDKPSARQGAIAALGLFLFAAVYGPAGFWLLRRGVSPHVTLRLAILQSSHDVIGVPDDPVLFPHQVGIYRYRVRWFEDSLAVICWFAMGYGLFMLLRPVLPQTKAGERDRQRVWSILETWGGPPLAYFTLLPDKQYLFDPASDPRWVIAYRLIGRHAVALGDPLGDPAVIPAAIQAYLAMCQEHDWVPVFYQVTGRYCDAFRQARLKLVKVGEDAVVDVPSFSMRGKAFQDLRTAINKMNKAGVIFEELPTRGASDETALTQLAEITEDWLHAHRGVEKNFAMGAFAPGSDLFKASRVFLAREPETKIVLAFVSFVPICGAASGLAPGGAMAGCRRGWGLDLMRRRSASPNGVVDFLIASALLLFQQEGEQVLSLGLSPLAGSSDDDPVDEMEILDRARGLMFERFNRFYNFKGLNAFKAKFGPDWQPRYLAYAGASALIPSAIAIVRAHNEPTRVGL